jgi:hypothetical protein
MGRPKGEETAVTRLPMKEVRMLRWIAKKLNLEFKDAFRRLASANIEDAHRRLKAGEHVELGGEG